MKKKVFRERYNEVDKAVNEIWDKRLSGRVDELTKELKTKKISKKKKSDK